MQSSFVKSVEQFLFLHWKYDFIVIATTLTYVTDVNPHMENGRLNSCRTNEGDMSNIG